MFTITRLYHFESGHWLPHVRDGHKCKNPHGHNYKFEVTLHSHTLFNGFIIDFWDLDALVQPIVNRIDHKMLNDIEGLRNPTAELIAEWLLGQIRDALRNAMYEHIILHTTKVQVWETDDCSAIAR